MTKKSYQPSTLEIRRPCSLDTRASHTAQIHHPVGVVHLPGRVEVPRIELVGGPEAGCFDHSNEFCFERPERHLVAPRCPQIATRAVGSRIDPPLAVPPTA